MTSQSHKSHTATLILAIFLGFMGIHRFYVGKAGTGILYFLTFGFLGLGWIIDIIMVASGSFTDKAGAWIKPTSTTPGGVATGVATAASPGTRALSDAGSINSSSPGSAPDPTGTTNPVGTEGQTTTAEKPIYTRWWFIVIVVVAVLAVISSLTGGDDGGGDEESTSVEQLEGDTRSVDSSSDDVGEEPLEPSPEPEPEIGEEEPERPDETLAQANAREAAESYLRVSGFSRSGLIDQLEFEGYSTDQASYAVDAVAPDWNEQALRSAQSYLNTSAFSRSGLIDQLEFEGYRTEEATYGVDQLGADWREQAARSAQSYLEFSSFSRQGLIDQLIFEGFSQEEAEYGVTEAGY